MKHHFDAILYLHAHIVWRNLETVVRVLFTDSQNQPNQSVAP